MTTPQSDQKLVWHYTTSSGLLGMIQNREIWATHARFVNDKLEGSVMHDAIRTFISDPDTLPQIQMDMVSMQYDFLTENLYPYHTRVPQGNMFLVCGSRDNDALTLWRNYAREEVSFAVGLNPQSPLGIIQSGRSIGRRRRDVVPWSDVEYVAKSDRLLSHHTERLCAAARSEDQGDQIVNVARELQRILSGVKHVAFEDERETRATFFSDDTNDWNFRSGRFGLTPYVKVGTSEQWGHPSDGTRTLPVEAIRASANASEADIMAVNALLESHGFGFGQIYEEYEDEHGFIRHDAVGYRAAIPVTQSQHPLRA